MHYCSSPINTATPHQGDKFSDENRLKSGDRSGIYLGTLTVGTCLKDILKETLLCFINNNDLCLIRWPWCSTITRNGRTAGSTVVGSRVITEIRTLEIEDIKALLQKQKQMQELTTAKLGLLPGELNE